MPDGSTKRHIHHPNGKQSVTDPDKLAHATRDWRSQHDEVTEERASLANTSESLPSYKPASDVVTLEYFAELASTFDAFIKHSAGDVSRIGEYARKLDECLRETMQNDFDIKDYYLGIEQSKDGDAAQFPFAGGC